MYEAFYGLNEKPFNLTPDPRFLFLSDKHKEAFAHLLYGIKNRTGFIMVSGEVGTGKTTICRSLLNQLDPDIEVAFIFNPYLSPEELLRKINEDFGILSQGRTVKELIDELNEYLLDRNTLGKNCVLVIDEAQDLSPTVLEQIRLLSNLETETQKLLQIVLIGQPELAQNLQLPELRQLNQRITARYHLRPLDQKETLQYIAYRLSTAGGRGQVRFTRGAIRAVFKASGGTPRVINAICDRALLIGYTRELRDISAGLVREAAREIRGSMMRKKVEIAPLLWRYLLPSATVLATAAALMGLVKLMGPFEARPTRLVPVAQAVTPEPPPAAPAAPVVTVEPATVAAPVAAPEAEVRSEPEPAKLTLAERLEDVDAAAARNAALAGILAAWNMAVVAGYPEGDEPATLADYGRANGLACETLTPALDQLMAIGLPALARMKAGDETRWVGLTGIEEGRFQITIDGTGAIEVPRDEFREAYANEAIVFWRDPAPNAAVLRSKARGAEVAQLKRKLRALSRLTGPATPVYDEETARAVARLQAETGLFVDGIAGKQVRMVMSSWMPTDSTPSLTKRESLPAVEPEPVVAVKDEEKTAEPETEPEAVAKDEEAPKPAAPAFDAGYNPLADLPLGPLPIETPAANTPVDAPPQIAAPPPPPIVQAPAVTVAPLPKPEAAPSAAVPPIPRLPGVGAPVAGTTEPTASEALAHELNS